MEPWHGPGHTGCTTVNWPQELSVKLESTAVTVINHGGKCHELQEIRNDRSLLMKIAVDFRHPHEHVFLCLLVISCLL